VAVAVTGTVAVAVTVTGTAAVAVTVTSSVVVAVAVTGPADWPRRAEVCRRPRTRA
jgi:hypothetical protein